jgi:hypothetical protein
MKNIPFSRNLDCGSPSDPMASNSDVVDENLKDGAAATTFVIRVVPGK